MKLTGIDAAKSKEGELVFRTEPPMTEKVLQELPNVWILGSEFGIDGDLLVWRGGSYPERGFPQQVEIFLTEAENAVQAKKTGDKNQHQAFLKKSRSKPASAWFRVRCRIRQADGRFDIHSVTLFRMNDSDNY